jgi:hypothetical protein
MPIVIVTSSSSLFMLYVHFQGTWSSLTFNRAGSTLTRDLGGRKHTRVTRLLPPHWHLLLTETCKHPHALSHIYMHARKYSHTQHTHRYAHARIHNTHAHTHARTRLHTLGSYSNYQFGGGYGSGNSLCTCAWVQIKHYINFIHRIRWLHCANVQLR